ncbi:peptide chain release factor N(5)-glutamine methyltransferase [Cryomorphaceae bacterium]|nr:peptide chain release factor N(5)-glutamine methyltransferase [Cryomorphaceae bacterium]
MNWSEAKKHLRQALPEESDREKDSLFFLIYEDLCGETRKTFLIEPRRDMSLEQEAQFLSITRRLQNHEPVQYILGKGHFFGRDFKVSPAVLIPRPETEELIHWAMTEVLATEGRCLDLGTGSGCLAVTWAAECPGWEVQGWDISTEALEVARENAASIVPQAPIEFHRADMLEPPRLDQPFDVMLSNPPYVRYMEQERMHPRVIEHEPSSALWVPNDDPLRFYQALARIADQGLRPDGHLFVEINQYLAKETEDLFRRSGFSWVHLKHDLSGNARLMHVRK